MYWAWEVDDIEERIIFQILKWCNNIAQSLECRGEEKKSNLTGLLCMTTLHICGAQEGRRRLREKHAKSCSGPVPGAWICCPTDMTERWALRERTCSACGFSSPRPLQTLSCYSASQLQVATATASGGGVVHSIQPLVVRVVFLGYSKLILAGPSQALGSPPCLWRLCPGPLSLRPGQLA